MLFNWSGLLSRTQTRESSQKGRELIMPMWQHLMFFLNPLQQCSCKSAFCWLSSANALILQTSNWMSFLAVLTSSHSPLLHQYSPLLLGLRGQIFIMFNWLYFNLRTLLFGVCRTISPTGPLHGLLGGRFIIAFFASLASVVTKGLSIGLVLHFLSKKSSSTKIL